MNAAFIWGLFLSFLMLVSYQSLVSTDVLIHCDISGAMLSSTGWWEDSNSETPGGIFWDAHP